MAKHTNAQAWEHEGCARAKTHVQLCRFSLGSPKGPQRLSAAPMREYPETRKSQHAPAPQSAK